MLSRLNKRQRITLLVIIVLFIAIPLILYLVKQQQTLRGRAAVNPNLVFVDSSGNVLPGDPPTTTTRDVRVKITHSGDSNTTPPPPSGVNPPPPTSIPVFPPPDQTKRRVFVTSVKYDGNLGGLEGADAKCQNLANQAGGESGLGGTWKAWLSETTSNFAKDRLSHFNGPYYLVDGTTKVANNFDDFIAGSGEIFDIIQHSIDMTEKGQTLQNPSSDSNEGVAGAVWTGTSAFGTSLIGFIDPNTYGKIHCEDWTSNTAFIGGGVGDYVEKGLLWTNSFIEARWGDLGMTPICAQQARLYCFEQ